MRTEGRRVRGVINMKNGKRAFDNDETVTTSLDDLKN